MAATQRLLAIISGKVQEYVAIIASAGTSSSGQIIAANAAGQLDTTFLPAGIGAPTQAMPASEALSAGALVNVYNNGGTATARNADGSVGGKEADGFVLAAVASGGTATVYFGGLNTGVNGLTPGLAYLSDTAVGAVASAGATTAGHSYQQVGTAVSATALDFQPQQPIQRT